MRERERKTLERLKYLCAGYSAAMEVGSRVPGNGSSIPHLLHILTSLLHSAFFYILYTICPAFEYDFPYFEKRSNAGNTV